MPCYHPITGYRSRKGLSSNGAWPVTFNRREGYEDKTITIPCGRCIGCRLERSRQWAIRCTHEASCHPNNCFVTLTYNDDYLPDNNSLNKVDIKNFLKRLRKKYGEGIRFFQCGEYGDELGRPHHHICIFNFDFPDKKIWSINRKFKYYRSESLEKLWSYGHAIITDLTFESAAYTARYITKKITGEKAQDHYQGRLPEYTTMSRKPGIGKNWWEKYKNDILVKDQIVVRANLIVKPAKYYDKLYHQENPLEARKIKNERIKQSALKAQDQTPDRLAIREKVKNLKARKLKRNYENA